jgi:hypothetical protein
MDELTGRPLRINADAESARADAPVYQSFPVLGDVRVDGFRLGMITDWEAEPSDYGDAFVVAPDGSSCGLNWEISAERIFERVCRPDSDRWGVWYVGFPYAMDSRESARRNLEYVLPDLRPKWEAWSTGRAERLRNWIRGRVKR